MVFDGAFVNSRDIFRTISFRTKCARGYFVLLNLLYLTSLAIFLQIKNSAASDKILSLSAVLRTGGHGTNYE